ncbi:MAG: sodium-dependent transporter [Patescibacteria group bacterium]|nr:sodium-dependent transporter [Patescibacteria group bacterium]
MALFSSRERWSSRAVFVFAAIGSAVGLGNVWRFPFIVEQNGGGAFLIPYFVALLTAGIPLMILEFGLGQKMQAGAPGSLAKIKKSLEWIGWLGVMVSAIVVTYYMVVMAWSMKYLYHSFSAVLPWADNEGDFFMTNVLQMTPDPGVLGGLVWPLVLALAICWIIIFLILYKGVGRVGKIVKWTVPLPVILLLILLVRGLTLDGAAEGVTHYLTADFSVLRNPSVWLAAYGQIFFSLSLGAGLMIAYASYLPKKADINNNAFITSLSNCGISFFAGFVVFSVLGYLAVLQNAAVADVAAGGPGLAFVVFPMALAKLPYAPFFAVVFFLSLLTLGVDSAFSLVEAVVTAVKDKFPKWKKSIITGVLCIVFFLIGLIFVTHPGLVWLDIVDHWLNNYIIVVVGLLQCIAVGYYYGAEKFRDYVNDVSDVKVGKWWTFCVKYLTPAILIYSIIQSAIASASVPYEGYPVWAINIGGWGMTVVAYVLAILFMKDKYKVWLLAKLLWVVALVVLVATGHSAWAMFFFGVTVFYVGLVYFVWRTGSVKSFLKFKK